MQCARLVAARAKPGAPRSDTLEVELLRAAAHVILGDIVEHDMEQTCEELAAQGSVDCVKLGGSDHESIHAVIRKKHGRAAILVNNAGIAKPGLFAKKHRVKP